MFHVAESEEWSGGTRAGDPIRTPKRIAHFVRDDDERCPPAGTFRRLQIHHWSLCLLNFPHVFFRHAATMHFNFRESSLDLTKIGRCELNINCS